MNGTLCIVRINTNGHFCDKVITNAWSFILEKKNLIAKYYAMRFIHKHFMYNVIVSKINSSCTNET